MFKRHLLIVFVLFTIFISPVLAGDKKNKREEPREEKKCSQNTPTPRSTVTLTPTNTPTISITIEPTITPAITSTPTPTPTNLPTENTQHTTGGISTPMPEAPKCPNGDILNTPANLHVYRKTDTAIVKWFPTGGEHVDIYYKNNHSSSWEHAVGDIKNNGYFTITNLNPSLGYTFGVRQHTGCGGGETVTAIVIDPPSTLWKIFPVNYYIMSK